MTEAERDRLERQRYHDAFMMDLENYILEHWDARQGIPKGPRRHENELWAAHVKGHLEDADTTWVDYVSWVSQGGADEWFRGDE
jgi:hypothetical protein